VIDWTVFDQYPENTIECRCGAVYRSHAKMAESGGRLVLYSRKPCPACKESVGNARAVRGDPEEVVIRGKRV
jgi:hypothetical protein